MGPTPNSRRWYAVASAAVLLLLATAAYTAWRWPAWRAASDARAAFAAGRFDDARRAVDRWLRSSPDSSEAHFFKAKAALALGRSNDLADGLRRAERLGHPADRLAILWALVDAQAGRLDKAKPVLVRAFNEAEGPDPMIDEALARVLMELYEWPQAGAVLKRWGEDAPNDPRPSLWHAAVHRRREYDAETIAGDFREALRRDPKLLEARLGLAEELARGSRNAEAEPLFAGYLAARPDDPLGQLGAGRNAIELGDLDAARGRFEKALALDPDNGEVHLELAKFDRIRGDDAAALAHLDRAIALRPYDPAPRYNRRLALLRLKRAEEAREEQGRLDRLKAELDEANDLRERLDASPDDPSLQSRLAAWMFAHDFDQEGLKWSRKILADHPRHRETCALLSRYYEKKGDLQLAHFYRSQIPPGPPR